MAKTAILRVILTGADDLLYKEAIAAEAINPGALVALNSSGLMINNTTTLGAAGAFLAQVAVENDIFGKTISDAYAANESVIYATLETGVEFQATIAAGAAAIVLNDYLTPVSGGTWAKGTQATGVAKALAAVDNSGGSSSVRLRAIKI